ncbi:MAG: ATP-binding protein [Ectobacillus sp.]
MDRIHVLVREEIKAIKLFLWLFYIIFFVYDIFYYFIYPQIGDVQRGFPTNGLGYWLYIFLLLLLPLAIYFLKKGRPYIVKYIYFISYVCIDIINNFMIYWGTAKQFSSGNIVEMFIILFSPIFVNKRYFLLVSIGLITKYILFGISFKSTLVIVPTVLLFVFSIVSFLLLNRFRSYMSAITKMFEETKQTEKLAIIGQMATAIGHEIRNPLTALKGFTQLQQEKYPEDRDYYNIMISEIERIHSIVSELMVLGKPKSREHKLHDIKEILQYVISIVQQQANEQGVIIHLDVSEGLPKLECDEGQMKQVFINVVKNAIESMPYGGNIFIRSYVPEQHNYIAISIQDEGDGIAQEEIDKLGQPFYTTKTKGTGLGLMVTNKIIEEHHGTFNIKSKIGVGTKVEIILPASIRKTGQ